MCIAGGKAHRISILGAPLRRKRRRRDALRLPGRQADEEGPACHQARGEQHMYLDVADSRAL